MPRSREDKIDAAIARWHAAPPGVADEPLHEYLGWTWAEYCAYTERDELPPEREGAM